MNFPPDVAQKRAVWSGQPEADTRSALLPPLKTTSPKPWSGTSPLTMRASLLGAGVAGAGVGPTTSFVTASTIVSEPLRSKVPRATTVKDSVAPGS